MPEQENEINEGEDVSFAQFVFDEKPNEFKEAVRSHLFSAIQNKIDEFKPDVANKIFNDIGYNEEVEYEFLDEDHPDYEEYEMDELDEETLEELKLAKTFGIKNGKIVRQKKVVSGHKDKVGRKGSAKALRKGGSKKTDVKLGIKKSREARKNPGAKRKRKRTSKKSLSKRLRRRNK